MTTIEPDFGCCEPVTYWHTERTVMRDREVGHACYATIIGGRTPVEYMTEIIGDKDTTLVSADIDASTFLFEVEYEGSAGYTLDSFLLIDAATYDKILPDHQTAELEWIDRDDLLKSVVAALGQRLWRR